MTPIQDVTDAINDLIQNELSSNADIISVAKQWLENDILKIKLAIAYDAWLEDIDDHGLYLTLKEHIIYYLEHEKYLTELL